MMFILLSLFFTFLSSIFLSETIIFFSVYFTLYLNYYEFRQHKFINNNKMLVNHLRTEENQQQQSKLHHFNPIRNEIVEILLFTISWKMEINMQNSPRQFRLLKINFNKRMERKRNMWIGNIHSIFQWPKMRFRELWRKNKNWMCVCVCSLLRHCVNSSAHKVNGLE